MVLHSKVNSNSRQFLNLAIEGHLGILYSFTLFNHGKTTKKNITTEVRPTLYLFHPPRFGKTTGKLPGDQNEKTAKQPTKPPNENPTPSPWDRWRWIWSHPALEEVARHNLKSEVAIRRRNVGGLEQFSRWRKGNDCWKIWKVWLVRTGTFFGKIMLGFLEVSKKTTFYCFGVGCLNCTFTVWGQLEVWIYFFYSKKHPRLLLDTLVLKNTPQTGEKILATFHTSKLKMCYPPWTKHSIRKLILGRQSSPFGFRPIFRGDLSVSGRRFAKSFMTWFQVTGSSDETLTSVTSVKFQYIRCQKMMGTWRIWYLW